MKIQYLILSVLGVLHTQAFAEEKGIVCEQNLSAADGARVMLLVDNFQDNVADIRVLSITNSFGKIEILSKQQEKVECSKQQFVLESNPPQYRLHLNCVIDERASDGSLSRFSLNSNGARFEELPGGKYRFVDEFYLDQTTSGMRLDGTEYKNSKRLGEHLECEWLKGRKLAHKKAAIETAEKEAREAAATEPQPRVTPTAIMKPIL